MSSRWSEVVVDAIDPARLGRWWAEVLDYRLLHEDLDRAAIGPVEGTYPQLMFNRVSDAKSGRNRLHLDLTPDDQEAEVERLVDMGARRVDIGQGDDAPWVVLADPEGNEFCVLRARDR
ncbi:VOC family protein [Planosporangium mesophilum]|uniref:Glyoxalase n=1 Tax=Planosporangium mesophilum TaxID=689768 RepID=A0A8J3TCG6_9ACTN|nr:VOC family protein [Planosporangium mesophilum]NJC85524.1 VOC family protein [Planosporangium mesophilum]GII24610.1 glyoxalase [Planosporangium mesophilum]